jgi:hypothetical protein
MAGSEVVGVAAMSKRWILRWWIWGWAAFVPAGVLIPSSAVALAAHLERVQETAGYRFGDDGYAITMVALIAVGVLVALAGVAAHLVAWVGAVRNTRVLGDQRWFTAVLWVGLAGIVTTPLLGVGTLAFVSVMMAYLVAGPDGTVPDPRRTTPGKGAIVRWSGWGFAVAGAGLAVNMIGYSGLFHGPVWSVLAVESAGLTACLAGGVVVCAAWWAALFNSHELPDRTWFHRVLAAGVVAAVLMPLFGLGALVLAGLMIAYHRSAPDRVPPVEPTVRAPAELPVPSGTR